MNKKLFILLALGFILRIIFIRDVPFSDGLAFRYWAFYLQDHSLATLFHLLPNGYTPYPPLYYYILRFLGWVVLFLHLENNWFVGEIIMRTPYFMADMVSGVLIFNIVKKIDTQKAAYISSAFFLFHPALLITSGWWGQNDSIVIMLGLSMVFTMLYADIRLAWLLFIFGVLIKVQMAALLPLLIFGSVKHLKKLLPIIPIYGIFAILPFIPVILQQGLGWTVAYFRQLPNWYPYTSIYATNIWSVFGFIVSDSTISFFGIPLKLISLGMTGLLALVIVLPFFKTKQKPDAFFKATLLLFFTFALFSTRVHSRYFIYLLPFLAIYSTQYIIFSLLLSIFILINLFMQANGIGIDGIVTAITSTLFVRTMIVFGILLYVYFFNIKLRNEKT